MGDRVWYCSGGADSIGSRVEQDARKLAKLARGIRVPLTPGRGDFSATDGVEYAINRCTRRCSVGERPLEPGECYYSVIVSHDEEVKRVDIAEMNWTSPPEGAVGWWKSQIPQATSVVLKPAPDAVLLETLSHLCDQPNRGAIAFLLAVLLVRRHLLVEPDRFEDGVADSDVWLLHDPTDGREYRVPRHWPTKREAERLQKELYELLYCEAT